MADRPFNVLFLCTGNSARSLLAECLVNHLGQGRFRGYSAGSHPKGEVHPLTIRELQRNGLSTDGLRSKDMAEFEGADAPQMDFVFTVCDQAAAEVCPVWPGHPMTAHWGVEDPAAADGDERMKEAAFAKAYQELRNRIAIFVELPIESLNEPQLKEKLAEIGRIAMTDSGGKGNER
ncbi:arsenate reductase ArsC [Methylomarinum vadi]|uniref:arsenate reductase ArsC n=1 Tax=Methylomarinum vadi TaxID=438855 RepID=UPI0004DF6A12|nr:arsenate reductase ArsC [Methylomarinum vadi]